MHAIAGLLFLFVSVGGRVMFVCGLKAVFRRSTSRIGTRSLWLALGALPLVSCTSVEIEDHSLQFNQATGSLGNRLLLLNTLRAAKGYPLQFSKIASYQGASRLDGGLSLSLPFIADVIGKKPTSQLLQGSLTPTGTLKSGVSQLALADLNTAEFQRALHTGVKAHYFVYYRQQGWPTALVSTVLLEEVLVEPRLLAALDEASQKACRNSGKERQKGHCEWLQRPKTRECVSDRRKGSEPRASHTGDLVRAFTNDPRKDWPHNECRHVGFQWFFAAIRVLDGTTLSLSVPVDTEECKTVWRPPIGGRTDSGSADKDTAAGAGSAKNKLSESVKDGKLAVDVRVTLDKGEKDEDADKEKKSDTSIGLNIPRGLSGERRQETIDEYPSIDKLRNEYLCLVREGKTPIAITLRSPERMVRFLGDVLAAQSLETKRMIQILDGAGHLVDLFRVEMGHHFLTGGAAVAVDGPEGDSYYIPISAPGSSNRHLSLQALALVMESLNLAVSGKELPRPSTIIVPGG
jgi:hypothetical protein